MTALAEFAAPPRRRRGDTVAAPTVEQHGDLSVGMEVRTSKRPYCGPVEGRITKLVMPVWGWRFAVVEDALGNSHACDFEELIHG